MKRRKGNGKGKGEGRLSKTGRAFFGGEQDKILNMCRRRLFLVVQKREKQERLVKVQGWLSEALFSPIPSQIKAQARVTSRTKAEERTIKDKARKALILNLYFQLLKHPLKNNMAMPGNQRTCMQGIGLTSPGPQLRSVWLESSHCMDRGSPFVPYQPSKTRGFFLKWLHKVDWIKKPIGNFKKTCVVLLH